MDTIRTEIAKFKGEQFSNASLPEHSNIHAVLRRLESAGEIVAVGWESTRGKPRKLFKEVKLKTERANAAKTTTKPQSPWSAVWPEFFCKPKLSGRSRMIVNLTNTEDQNEADPEPPRYGV